jgi:DNA-binding winged helix-turn-helix (wHTH) protein/tetratricopeptide (TPR) repeat protein
LANETRIIFAPFCLDRANECLWKGAQVIKLRPKAFAVLNHLVGRRGQLVTKEELLTTVWADTFVSDAVLKVTIRQLRDALDDDPKTPLFIETAHRRGYRFIGQITESEPQEIKAPKPADTTSLVASRQRDIVAPLGFVGRNEALVKMKHWLEAMLRGEPQLVFVTGEAGIGKTALVDTFARYVAFDPNIRIARGQCLEQYGTSEAYLPILEALSRLSREQSGMTEVLRTHAPMWLLQMPSLLSVPERETLHREVFGATPERMLREMAGAMELLTSDQPLVLILEDLHWSDWATLDLISYLARQRRATHLMIIGTYRPVELIVSGHPLKAVKQELLAKQQCAELPLAYLNEEAIAKYLSIRFPAHQFPAGLTKLLYERTEGNPLFMVNAVEYLVTENLIVKQHAHWELVVSIEQVELGVPESIKQMIQKQIDKLDPAAQRTLEVASVVGVEFSTLALSAGLEDELVAVEARCDQLARQRHFIHDCGVQLLPNGEAVGRYGFVHALYQNVLYDRTSHSRRIQLHRRIAERGEAVYGERAREIATELAVHFERGQDYQRAARYLQNAADNAIRRFAYREAVTLAQRGLELLAKLPDGAERAQQELCLQLTLGVPLIATEGYAATAVGNRYTRARELCQQIGDTPDVAEALWGLRSFYVATAELEKARAIGEEFLRLAERLPYPGLAMRGHFAMEIALFHLGDITGALKHFDEALALFVPDQHRDDALYYSQNPGVAMRCFAAWALWFAGQLDESLTRMQEALALAQELREPPGLAYVYYFSAILHQLRGEPALVQKNAEAALAVNEANWLGMYQGHAAITRGWAQFEQGRRDEGLKQMREGVAIHQAHGTVILRPYFLALLADALRKHGETTEALALLEEALGIAHRKRDEVYLAELYRLKGEVLQARGEDAESCFREALQIAQRQHAKSLEWRAASSLARYYPAFTSSRRVGDQ